MTTREEFVAQVRTYIDTPYHEQARKPGIGMDCPAPVIVGCWDTGLKPRSFDVKGYTSQPDGHTIRAFCDRYMERIEVSAVQIADVLLCAFRNEPERHIGIVTDATPGRMKWIEAEGYRFKRVIEVRLVLTSWAMRITQAYRIPGIA